MEGNADKRKLIKEKNDELVKTIENVDDAVDFSFELRFALKEWLKEHHTSDRGSINRKDPAWNLINNLQYGIKFAMNSNASDVSLSSILSFNSELCDLIRKYYGDVK
jgi:hypothetical protein